MASNKYKILIVEDEVAIAELEKDSEMKAHLNSILAKRMERSIKKEEIKRDNYKAIKEMFEKHPKAKNLVKSMVNNKKQIKTRLLLPDAFPDQVDLLLWSLLYRSLQFPPCSEKICLTADLLLFLPE